MSIKHYIKKEWPWLLAAIIVSCLVSYIAVSLLYDIKFYDGYSPSFRIEILNPVQFEENK
jgi:hypothetical protein